MPQHQHQHLRALAHRAAEASARARSKRAAERARDLAPIIAGLRSEGARSLRTVAVALAARGFTSPRGKVWTATAVRRVLARMEKQVKISTD